MPSTDADAQNQHRPEDLTLGQEHLKHLLGLARNALQMGYQDVSGLGVSDEGQLPPILKQNVACCVRIYERESGLLRGEKVSFQTDQIMVNELIRNVSSAGYQDPNFLPITPEEVPKLRIQITLINPPEQFRVTGPEQMAQVIAQRAAELPGLVIQDAAQPGIFAYTLPMDWQQFPQPADLVGELMRRSGAPPGHWPDSMISMLFIGINFTD
ncbi:MAG: AMMECR1 domain-containing protein [Gammaproteobacteria bacterium AqS3]|nr:AMMECR1 domain-containing protein [Gammaproteobacteria bacterium AqS3]